MTRWRLALLGVSLWATAASAVDQPIDGAKIVIRRTASGAEKLVFVSRDPSALFPALGGADDPSLVGSLIELFSGAEPGGAALSVPPGTGVPGWSTHHSTSDSYRYANRDAPDGPSVVKVVALKEGRVLKISARETGLVLTTLQGAVGIRVTTGSLRNCALFYPTEVRTDVPGTYVARNSSTVGVADCSNVTLGGAPLTTTTTSTTTTTATTPGSCGDGVCFTVFGEYCATCPVDCGPCGTCVIDGTCDHAAGESCRSCSDCGSCSCTVDGVCDTAAGENCASCGIDCNPCFACGDGFCAGGETCATCPDDCCP